MKYFRFTYLLFFLLWFHEGNAQNNNRYLGVWDGYFNYKFPDGRVEKRRFRLDFHSINRDTLFAKALSYGATDSTKVNGSSDKFNVLYDYSRNTFSYTGWIDQSEKRKVTGKFHFRFHNSDYSSIIGTFDPLAPSRRDPEVNVILYRATSLAARKEFEKAFRSDFFSKKVNPQYENCQCDDKVYSIVKGFIYETEKDKLSGMQNGETSNGQSIREFKTLYPNVDRVLIHKEKLPFPSVALAKGFDNILYSVSSVMTDKRLKVYKYNPVTFRGEYTNWILPSAAGSAIFGRWLSGGTDPKGNIYFMTESAEKFVKINPVTDEVSVVWDTCPLGTTSAIFNEPLLAHQSSYGNFCFDENGILYMVTGKNGNVIEIDISEDVPRILDMYSIKGLPETGMLSLAGGSYGDILMHKDPHGVNRTYVTGGHEIYEVNLDQRVVVGIVAPFNNADLAGCNIFFKRELRPDKDDSARIVIARIPTVLDISFKQSKADFLDEKQAYSILNEWVETMKLRPTMMIRLTGHTDNQGDKNKNLDLSRDRAIQIKKYLVKKGIVADRISSIGMGGEVPKASNDTEEGRGQNRRVELLIIKE